jgi:N-acetylglucosaminyl-diphospho-decaprenol L-rhamnosyltransferase
MSPDLSIVVVTYNSARWLEGALASVREACGTHTYEVVVVDNGSADQTVQVAHNTTPTPRIIVNGSNVGFGAAANIGARATSGSVVVICNADIVFSPGSLEVLVRTLRREPRLGVVGPQLEFPGGAWQRSGGAFASIVHSLSAICGGVWMLDRTRELLWQAGWRRTTVPVDYVDGTVMALPRMVWEHLGGFDERYFFYWEDADLCYRARERGWRVRLEPTAVVTHLRGAGSSQVSLQSFVAARTRAELQFVANHHSPRYTSVYAHVAILRALLNEVACRAIMTAFRVTPRWARRAGAYRAQRLVLAGREVPGTTDGKRSGGA